MEDKVSILTEMEYSKVPAEVREFEAVECFDCEFDGHIPQRWFFAKYGTEDQVDSIMKNQKGIGRYSVTTHNDGFFCSACKCPQCGSENVIVDL